MAGEVKRWLRSIWELLMCSHGGAGAAATAQELNDPLLWSHDLGRHSAGEFSFAAVRAHIAVEDQSQVETGDGAIFVGVYDGHYNDIASRFVCDNLFLKFIALAQQARAINEEVLTSAFAQTESAFLDRVAAEHRENPEIKGSGSCCLVGVIRGRTLYVANAGDSRVVVGQRKGLRGIEAVALTRDDNARLQDVRDEVRAANPQAGIEFKNGAWRVKGIIQVTKSLGDAYLKLPNYGFETGHKLYFKPPLEAPALSAEPTVLRRELKSRDQFLIFASDGLWDVLSNTTAVEIVHNNPRNGIAKTLIKHALREAADNHSVPYNDLVRISAQNRRVYHDDISVVVVFLDGQAQQNPAPTPVQIRGNGTGVLPGRFDLRGVQ